MTCIVGLERGNTVFIGGDSAMTYGDSSQRSTGDPKVFVVQGKFAFGVCGSPKVMNVLNCSVEFPEQEKGVSDQKYIINEVIPVFRAGLEAADCMVEHPKLGKIYEGAVLMGYQGKLYHIECNLQVITNAYGFDAVGAGQDIAIGSLQSTKYSPTAKGRILKALEAAAINNATVRPPFNVVSVKKSLFGR